jgi:hypothetical protein
MILDLRRSRDERDRRTVWSCLNGGGPQMLEAPAAYMFDPSRYAGSRKRRETEPVEFWKQDSTETLRRIFLLYTQGGIVEKKTAGNGVSAAPEP